MLHVALRDRRRPSAVQPLRVSPIRHCTYRCVGALSFKRLGVATRGVVNVPPSPSLPSIQVNYTTAIPQPSYDPPPNQFDSHLSLSTYAFLSEPHERVVTPCEEEYKQLGGMKFGTLRITNGSPARSPAVEISNPVALYAPNELAWPLKEGVTSTDMLYPDHKAKTAQPPSNDLPPVLSNAIDKSTVGQIIELDMKSSWLLGPNEEYLIAATPSLEPTDSRSTSDRQLSPDSNTNIPGRGKLDGEYLSREVLDVREDPSAKYAENNIGPRFFGKPSRSSITRSDSGFVSTSTSSSTSSRKTLSQADSGYSSNFSLRSTRDGSAKKSRDGEAATRMLRHSSRPSLENGTQAGKGSRSTPSSRLSFAFMSRLSTRASKNPEPPLPEGGASPKHSRTKSADGEASYFEGISETSNTGTPSRPGKLHRLLTGSTRRQSFPTAYMSHDIHDAIPAVPSDIEEKLREHSGLFPTASKRIALRVEPSQETLNTILSVESQDLADVRAQDAEPLDRGAQPDNISRSYGSQHRRESVPVLPRAPAQAQDSPPSWSLAPRASIKRKPLGTELRNLGRSGEDCDSISEYALKGVVAHKGAHATDFRISTNVDGDKSGSPRLRRTLTKPEPKKGAPTSESHALKSRASAPVLTESLNIGSDPTSSQSSLNSSKSPPPISMRNRSANSSSRQNASQLSSTASEVARSVSQKSSRESLDGHQRQLSQKRTQELSTSSKQPQIRHSYGGSSRQTPIVSRQSNSRDRNTGSRPYSDDHGQQYRILHSYNSPAYRNAPIWG